MGKAECLHVDLTDCRYVMELYDRLRISLQFPDYFGNNLHALWDVISEPWDVHITFVGTQTMSTDCKQLFQKILSVFEDVQKDQMNWGHDFQYEVQS